MTVLCENIFNIMVILLVSLFRLIKYWHCFNNQGRSEIIKKYGFIPSKSQRQSSSSDSDSSSSDEEPPSMLSFQFYFYSISYIHDEYKIFFFLTAIRPISEHQSPKENSGGFM